MSVVGTERLNPTTLNAAAAAASTQTGKGGSLASFGRTYAPVSHSQCVRGRFFLSLFFVVTTACVKEEKLFHSFSSVLLRNISSRHLNFMTSSAYYQIARVVSLILHSGDEQL